MRKLISRLGLTPAQRTQLRQLHARTMAEIWTTRSNELLTAGQRHDQIRAAKQAERRDFRNLLTPDQLARLDQIMSHHHRAQQD